MTLLALAMNNGRRHGTAFYAVGLGDTTWASLSPPPRIGYDHSVPTMQPGALFAPLVLPYGAVTLVRRYAYDHKLLPVHKPPVPTFSVGGLEAGGSGKTPVAGLVLRALLAAGRAPGLLTRGYGRPCSTLSVRARGQAALAESIGDEPAMLVSQGLDVAVAACPSRRQGAIALLAENVDCVVLDDGFQHRALGRDVDIVVLRGEAPLGNGHLLPWGTLREPATSLRRASLVWLHFRDTTSGLVVPAWLHKVAPQAEVVVSTAASSLITDGTKKATSLSGSRVLATTGIARPAGFFQSLQQLGADVCARHPYRDHHRFSRGDVADLVAAAKRQHLDAVVVTAKDAVKLAALWPDDVPLWVLRMEPKIVSGAEALATKLGVLSSHLRQP